MNVPRRRRPSVRAVARAEDGVLSLEFALVVPVFFLLVLVLFEFTGVARDALAVQNAAREGARAAATNATDDAVRAAVTEALGGRTARIEVTPRTRTPGQLVHVEVGLATRPVRLTTITLRGTATARVEAVTR